MQKRRNVIITDHVSVIAVAVVRTGVTPEPVEIVGDTVPAHNKACVPVGGVALDLLVEKFDTTPLPPVPAGKVMLATGEQTAGALPVTVQAALDRATLTRV